MHTLQSSVNFDVIDQRYKLFLSNPAAESEIHLVLTTTDPDVLLEQNRLFYDFLEVPARTPVLILHPRRFGATRMADRFAYHTNTTLGHEVGLAGIRGANRESFYHGNKHRAVVANYGHALGHHALVHTSDVIVLCNTEEQTLPMTLVKAAIKQRLSNGERLFLVILTNNDKQFTDDIGYYEEHGISRTYEANVSRGIYQSGDAREANHTYLFQQQNTHSVADVVVQLLRDNLVKRGMVVCVADQISAIKVDERLREVIAELNWEHVSYATLHNRTTVEFQRTAMQEPEAGKLRILINIGALEASNLRVNWADTIVSDGLRRQYGKVLLSGGSEAMVTDASMMQINQQMQISGFATPVAYFLCSPRLPIDRLSNAIADLHLLPYADAVLQSLEVGLDPLRMTYDAGGIPHGELMETIGQLIELGFVKYELSETVTHAIAGNRRFLLTENGQLTRNLQLGVHSKAALVTAMQLGIVDTILPLIATMEAGGVRRRIMVSHGADGGSDLLDTTAAFTQALAAFATPRPSRTMMFEQQNISFLRVQVAQRVLAQLAKHCATEPNFRPYREVGGVAIGNPELRQKIKACIFAAGGQSVFRSDSVTSKKRRMWKLPSDRSYDLGNASVLATMSDEDPRTVISGHLRLVIGKVTDKVTGQVTDRPFTIIEYATAYTNEDLWFIAQNLPHLVQATTPSQTYATLSRGKFWLTHMRLAKPVMEKPVRATSIPTAPDVVESNTIELSVVHDTPTVKSTPAPVTKPAKVKSEMTAVADPHMSEMVGQMASAWGANVSVRKAKRA